MPNTEPDGNLTPSLSNTPASATTGLAREKLPHNPVWIMKAGMGFGGLVLLSFIALAVLAGIGYPLFICDSFALLAAVFAFGAALSGAFIGGSAAALGTLGNNAAQQSLRYSVGGGVAFFVIAFVIFKLYEPSSEKCTPPLPNKEVHLSFSQIPLDLVFAGLGDRFWRIDSEDRFHRSLVVLAQHDSKHATLYLRLHEQSEAECTLFIRTERTEESLGTAKMHRLVLPNNELQIELDKKWRDAFVRREQARKLNPNSSAGFKEIGNSCFRLVLANDSIVGNIGIVSNQSTAFYAASEIDGASSPSAGPGQGASHSPSFNFISKALAEKTDGTRVAFGELRSALGHSDPNRRIVARRYLGEHFTEYESEVMKDLFSKNQSPDYISSLLHGLIAGIDEETNGKLAPGQSRNLSVDIRPLKDKYSHIIELTAYPDEGVRKQARRLIQRFPVDPFEASYSTIFGAQGCGRDKTPREQAILYSALFYYYNRIIQFGYENKFTQSQMKSLDSQVEKGSRLAQCLDTELQVDAAALIFAQAFVYRQHKSPKAKEYAREFLAKIDTFDSSYFSPSHIETAKRLANS